jgi:hypothetical protein
MLVNDVVHMQASSAQHLASTALRPDSSIVHIPACQGDCCPLRLMLSIIVHLNITRLQFSSGGFFQLVTVWSIVSLCDAWAGLFVAAACAGLQA